jgi:hypothetical protein
MNYLDGIIKAAAVLGALGVIFGVGVKAWRFIIRLNDTTKELKETLADLKTHSNENYMSLLRLTIMSNEMPIGERIVAGHKYLKNGGNGEVKSFLKKEFNITDTIDEATHYKK